MGPPGGVSLTAQGVAVDGPGLCGVRPDAALCDGAHEGDLVLSSEAVTPMTTDQLTAAQCGGGPDVPAPGPRRGYGVAVTVGVTHAGVPRRDGWDGGYGTSWRTDTALGAFAIVLTRRLGLTGTAPSFLDL